MGHFGTRFAFEESVSQDSIIKAFFNQLLGNILSAPEAIGIESGTDAPVAEVDCFTGDSRGGESENGLCEKIGISKRTATLHKKAIDLSGEVLRSADPTKVFDKLVHDGHQRDMQGTESELLTILSEIEHGMATQKTATPNITTPIGVVLGEIREDLPLLDETQEEHREHGRQQDSDADSEAEDGDEENAETKSARAEVASRLTTSKMSTFA